MQVSLRKANAIQVAINDAIKNLEFNEVISINEFQNAETEISLAALKFATNVTRQGKLLDALYSIRKAVSIANSTNEINSHLADIARYEKQITFSNRYAKSKVTDDISVINGKLDRVRNRKEESFYGSSDVNVSIFSQEVIDEFRTIAVTSKKLKQKLQDELLELNVRTQIDLSDQTVTTLTEENIL